MKKRLIWSLILGGIVILFIILFFFSTISPGVKGVIKDSSTGEPLENIKICYQKSGEFFHSAQILDQGCIFTNNEGEYKIPGKYRLFSLPVNMFRIYYNRKIILPDFSLEGTDKNPVSENELYTADRHAIVSVSFPRGISMYIPHTVNKNLSPKS